MNITYKSYLFNGITVKYLLDEESSQIAMVLLPDTRETCYEERREWLQIPELMEAGTDPRAWEVGSLCHLALRHHNQGNGAGNTLKHGQSTKFLKFHSQHLLKPPQNQQIGQYYRLSRYTEAYRQLK